MINRYMYDLGDAPNKIRELFMYGLGRKQEIGADKVFDYSIGNPSVPAPDSVRKALLEDLDQDPVAVHEYSPSPGIMAVRKTVAEHISKTFDTNASASEVYMTSGASSAIAIAFCAVSNPGDEIITVSPYFPEYKTWATTAGCKLVEVPTLEPSFQMDLDAIRDAITERTSAIIINSPNNPTGAVYPRQDLEKLGAIMKAKCEEYGHDIFLVSDEPYREIVYGEEVPFVPSIYDKTIICYTWSKSLSLPGERIGYVYVNSELEDATTIFTAICGAGRALGYICAPVLLQRAVAKCIDEPSDIESYASNRELLMGILSDIGYEYVKPEGAFYLWMKSLEPDAEAFSDRAKQFELLVVPSNSFGCGGWVRLSYCISEKTISESKDALKALFDSYQ